ARADGDAQDLPPPGIGGASGGRPVRRGGGRGERRRRHQRREARAVTAGSAVPPLFSWPTRAYWEDTDAGGVVYHAQYLAFLERARTEWLRALGYGQELLRRDHDLVFAVRAMRLEFLRPARLDDALAVTAGLRECRRASVVFHQAVLR